MAVVSRSKPKRGKARRAKGKTAARRRLAFRVAKWGLILFTWASLSAGALVAWYAFDLPPMGDLPALDRRPAVTLLAADGEAFSRFGEARGEPVSVAELPPHVPRAVLAVEDARFYDHFGIDLIGLARAMGANVMAGRIVQGGSTITQQLAKNLFLGPERTIKRKVQEMILSLWLEDRFTKDEILALYLNRVYFGAGNFGIEAAAQSYFGKPARALELNEAAMLAGLLKAPSRYAPTKNPSRAAGRAAIVVDRMADTGFITRAQARMVKRNPARLGRQQVRIGRYFADWALEQARGYVGAGRGDLIVRTTLDLKLQRAVEHAVGRMLAGPAKARGVSQAAVVVLESGGAIKALVGGADYGKSQFNRATQALRQPGSAFKPFVYLAALEAGLSPDSVMTDAPVVVGDFRPKNYGDRYYGRVTLTEGLARSLNSVAVRLIQHAGIDRTIRWARRLGITAELRREAGLALGASEVTVLEMAQAYAALANGGDAVFAHGIDAVRDERGQVLYRRHGSGPGGSIGPRVLGDMNNMMHAVLDYGTGRNGAFGRPAAAKSGTTQDYRDAWFIGYSADYVAAVWMGNDDGRPMDRVTGGGLPAKLWREVMLAAHRSVPEKPLPRGRERGFFSRLFGGGGILTPEPGPEPREGLRPPRYDE